MWKWMFWPREEYLGETVTVAAPSFVVARARARVALQREDLAFVDVPDSRPVDVTLEYRGSDYNEGAPSYPRKLYACGLGASEWEEAQV